MAQALKDSFGPEVAQWIGSRVREVEPGFDLSGFLAESALGFNDLELMDRARHIAAALGHHLPADPREAVALVTASLGPIDPTLQGMGPMRYLPLAVFVGQVGLPAFEESMTAQYELTKRFTAEFSIRPFLAHEPQRTLARLREWTADPDENVRRLVSEGTRPRLPWAARLPAFIADPAPVLELLELLRDDPSEYVRRSVANNLNDISKDHPEVVCAVASRWWGDADQQRRRTLRSALRTLVKKGDPQALAILGHGPAEHVELLDVQVQPARAAIGERVRIAATIADLRRPGAQPEIEQIAVDFVVHFVKANGSRAPRVFKGGLPHLAAAGRATLTKSVSLAQLSTRTHYPGRHRVEVQVNGRLVGGQDFEVVQR